VGAFCAPIVCGAVAQAHTLLGEKSIVRAEVAAKYLPWIHNVQDPNVPGSVAALILAEGKLLADAMKELPDKVPARFKNRFPRNFAEITELQPGQQSAQIPVACVQYNHQVGWRETACLKRVRCDANTLNVPLRNIGIAVKGKDGLFVLPSDAAQPEASCGCEEWLREPVWADGEARTLLVKAENKSDPQTGPALSVAGSWLDSIAPEHRAMGCEVGAQGPVLPEPQERKQSAASQAVKDWDADLEKLRNENVGLIEDGRKILWTYFNLLEGAKEAERRIRRIFQL
jgi:hypothetical protein